MTLYILRRLALAAATVVAATLLTFVLLRLAPGEPAQVILTRIFIQDLTATTGAADVGRIAQRFGLNDPILVQYGRWLIGALGGDFGASIRTGRPVLTELGWRLSATALLAALAMPLALALAFAAAMARRLRLGDRHAATRDAIAITLVALPSFYLGVLVIMLFAVRLDWLPVSGFDTWAHAVLPVAVLALGQLGFILILLEDSLEEALAAAHIATAAAKGRSDAGILIRHALPNALAPLLPYAALQFTSLLGGAIVVERLFAIPGLGAYLTDALESHDAPAFLGAVAAIAAAAAATNLAADLAAARIDPRIRLQRFGG